MGLINLEPQLIDQIQNLKHYASIFSMYVYILECSDHSYYVGVTNNLEKRLSEHSDGKSKTAYKFSRRPVNLVYYVGFQNATSAIDFEKKIKKWSRAKKEALVKGEFESLPELSKKKFD